MRASTVRIAAVLGLLLALAVGQHWIGPGPDGPSQAHAAHATHATAR
jgi:hypothetical protein